MSVESITPTGWKEIFLRFDFVTGGGGEIQDVIFNTKNPDDPRRIAYPVGASPKLQQVFSGIFVRNLAGSNVCVFSILYDKDDDVVLTAAGGSGMLTVNPGNGLFIDARDIARLRLYLDGAGSVEAVLFGGY